MDDRKAVKGLSCPKCGGIVPIPEGQQVVLCPYCDLSSLVQGVRGIRRYQVSSKINRDNAIQSLKKFFGNWAIARDVSSKAQLTDAFLAYLPFWAMWGRALGWAFGEEKVGSRNNTRYIPREIKITEDLTWAGAACDVGEFGVGKIDLSGRNLEPFSAETLHSNGMVFEPIGSISDAQSAAERDFDRRARSRARLNRISQIKINIVNSRFGLVYYPVWILRYQYKGRSFQVVVDGHSGQVLYGKAPGNTLYRAAVLVVGMALGAFLAIDGSAFAVSLSADGDNDVIGVILILLVVGLGLMGLSYRTFRFGEQYEFGGAKKFDPELLIMESPGDFARIAMDVVGFGGEED